MPSELLDDAWSAMLTARQMAARGIGEFAFVRHGETWDCVEADSPALEAAHELLHVGTLRRQAPAGARISCYRRTASGVPTFEHPGGRPVDARLLTFARLYLPTVLGAAAARAAGRSFVIAHVTQTLDGRIACENGQSQWIGNDEDLRHSHRMRALCDGVLVGAETAIQDDPRLTVRHVDGPNPRRIVLSGRGRALAGMERRHLATTPGCIVVLQPDVAAVAPSDQVALMTAERTADARLDPGSVLARLRSAGVHSLYVEGGANTVSSFLQAAVIDLLQVHVASILLGSGVASFTLPPVQHVRYAVPFTVDHVALDGHLLLNCWPQR